MTENAIEIKNLCKTYKEGKIALTKINLTIPKGSIYALLGPNGAGKSTMINILSDLSIKTSGEIKVLGMDFEKNLIEIKKKIGIVPQEIFIDPFFNSYDLLELQAGLYGLPKNKRNTDNILEKVSLGDKKTSSSRSLSGGMKRRLLIAKAMVHDPDILILDEPTAGVDIELRKKIWTTVKELNKQGKTIIITTHYLEEAEELCDYVAVINKGNVIVEEKKEDLLKRFSSKYVELILDKEMESCTNIPQKIKQIKGNVFQIAIEDDFNLSEYTKFFESNGCKVIDINSKKTSLEDVFLKLTKE